jgi:hypothetical protein
VLWMLSREREARRQAEERGWREERATAAPPVVILNAGRGAELLPGGLAVGLGSRPRDFVIVGEEEEQRPA